MLENQQYKDDSEYYAAVWTNGAVSVPLDDIKTNGGTQSRVILNEATVNEYRLDMLNGALFPPVVVFYDGECYWLADGFHRVQAAKQLHAIDIEAEVKQGTRRDAVLYSVGANSNHGLRRTNADKRRAVMTLLEDEEWGKWSDSEIARRCGVSQPFVSGLRSSDTYNRYRYERAFVHPKTGMVTTMNTASMGNGKELIEDIADRYGVVHDETKEALHRLYQSSKKEGSSDTFGEVAATGYIQIGDENDAVHISEDPRLVRYVLQEKSRLHKAMLSDKTMDNGRSREPKPVKVGLPSGKSPRLIHGRAEQTGLDDNSIDLIITSPPYNLGNGFWAMGGNGRTPKHGIDYQSHNDAMPPKAYACWQNEVLREMWRVAKPGASLFYNHRVTTSEGKLVYPLKWLDTAENPWVIRQEIIWDRGSTHNHQSAIFWPEDERIYWMTKGDPELPQRPIGMSNIWRFHGPQSHDWHPATFSSELPKRCIEAIGRDGIVVLDPFCGSGTVLRVALEYGYDAIGVDISEEYLVNSALENGWDYG